MRQTVHRRGGRGGGGGQGDKMHPGPAYSNMLAN